MSLRWNLTHGSSDQRDVSARVRANTASVRINAEEGSVAISTVNLDDPDGDLIVNGLAGLFGSESEVPGTIYDQTFIRGFIADRTVSRGDDDSSFRTEAARKWAVNIADQNSLLSRRILLGNDANRPAETDVARVQYLMGTPEMNLIDEEDYINTGGAVAMDAADYRGQTCFDVLNDCAQASGKNFWVMFRPDIGNSYGLWYDFTSSEAYTSDISISNVLSDVDGTTVFAASFDTALVRDPSRVYSGVYMPYDGGTVYRQLASTASNFHPRDITSYSPNVKTAAKANARADRYLQSIATEEDRITTSIIVPNAQVQDLKEGHRVLCKFSHLPGYEDWSYLRVLNRTVEQVSEYYYQVTVELSGEINEPGSRLLIAVVASSRASGQDDGPIVDSSTHPWTLAYWSYEIAGRMGSPGKGGGKDTIGIYYRSIHPGEDPEVASFSVGAGGNQLGVWVFEVEGVDASGLSVVSDTGVEAYPGTSPSIGAVATQESVLFGGFGIEKVSYGQVTLISTTSGTNVIDANMGNESGGVCEVTNDVYTPRVWIGYDEGTGALELGGTVTCSGAIPDYPEMAYASFGLLLPLSGTFSIVQQAYGGPGSSGVTVTLPSAPTFGSSGAAPTVIGGPGGTGSGAGTPAGGAPTAPSPGAPAGSLQAAIDATPTNGTLDMTGYTYTGPGVVDRPMTLTGGTVTHPSGTKGIIIGADGVTLDTVTVTGPQYAVRNGNEYGIYSDGYDDITITDCVVSNEGFACVWIVGCTSGLNILGGHYYNAVYAGIMILECVGGSVHADLIERIGIFDSVSSGYNSYGVALSNLGGTQSNGITVGGQSGRRMVIDNVPDWHGVDTHAGINCTFSYIDVTRCNRAFFLTQDSSGRNSTGSVVNHVTAGNPTRRQDVAGTYPYNQVGLTVVSGCTASGDDLDFDAWPTGNHIDTQPGATGSFTNVTVTNPY